MSLLKLLRISFWLTEHVMQVSNNYLGRLSFKKDQYGSLSGTGFETKQMDDGKWSLAFLG